MSDSDNLRDRRVALAMTHTLSSHVKEIRACRLCGFEHLDDILSLGDLHVSTFVKKEGETLGRAPLDLVLCNKAAGGCGLLQLKHTFSPEKLYGEHYWYRSGINQTMTQALRDVVTSVEFMVALEPGDCVVDIGSNDSTLLRAYSVPGIHRVGFEPSKNLIPYGEPGVTRVINSFFNADAWEREFPGTKAKIITAIAMFYDLENPNAFVADVGRVLDDDGLFVVQQAYLPYILDKNIIDNTVHEHLEYYSLMAMNALLARHNMEVFDVELNDVNAGSFRTYIRKRGRGRHVRLRSGAEDRLREVSRWEKDLCIDDKRTYDEFAKRVYAIRDQLRSFVVQEVRAGKTVYVYGASTKGNTLLQFCNLDNSLIVAAAERNPDKWGTMTVGTHIPVISEEEARAARPDYFLVLPWQFMDEFIRREEQFLKNGGKFLVPLPSFRVIDSPF